MPPFALRHSTPPFALRLSKGHSQDTNGACGPVPDLSRMAPTSDESRSPTPSPVERQNGTEWYRMVQKLNFWRRRRIGP